MKKVLLLLLIVSIGFTSFAQELSAGLQAKNDGNNAYKAKNYVKAIENWNKYLNSGEEGAADDANTKSLLIKSYKYAAGNFMKAKKYSTAFDYFEKYVENGDADAKKDGKTQYYMAYCANKLDKNDLALSKYQNSINLAYKEDACMLYMADIYKDTGNEEKMISTLKEGMEKFPDSKYRSKMVSMLITPMLKEAAVPFNEANELAKVAATSDPAQYIDNMENAVTKFNNAIPLFDDVLALDPDNDQAKTYLNACKDNIKSFNNYKSSLKK